MPAEISNHITQSQSLTPSEEVKNGAVRKNPTQAQSESGQGEKTVHITENAKQLEYVRESIKQGSVVDMERVEQARQKLEQRGLDMQGDANSRQMAFDRLAGQIIDTERQLSKASNKE